MDLWVMSQDGEKLVLTDQFEVHASMEGAVIYANCSLVGRYKSKERAKFPECGAKLSFTGGCNICTSCGFSKCD